MNTGSVGIWAFAFQRAGKRSRLMILLIGFLFLQYPLFAQSEALLELLDPETIKTNGIRGFSLEKEFLQYSAGKNWIQSFERLKKTDSNTSRTEYFFNNKGLPVRIVGNDKEERRFYYLDREVRREKFKKGKPSETYIKKYNERGQIIVFQILNQEKKITLEIRTDYPEPAKAESFCLLRDSLQLKPFWGWKNYKDSLARKEIIVKWIEPERLGIKTSGENQFPYALYPYIYDSTVIKYDKQWKTKEKTVYGWNGFFKKHTSYHWFSPQRCYESIEERDKGFSETAKGNLKLYLNEIWIGFVNYELSNSDWGEIGFWIVNEAGLPVEYVLYIGDISRLLKPNAPIPDIRELDKTCLRKQHHKVTYRFHED